MGLWDIPTVSELLDCTQQNIYQKKSTLRKMGYLEIDPIDKKEKINENGLNYLREMRTQTLKRQGRKANIMEQDSEHIEKSCNVSIQQDFVFDFMKKELEDLKTRLVEAEKEKTYWRDLYIQQVEDFKKMAYPTLLDTKEGNEKTEAKVKNKFIAWFFK